MDPHDDPIPIVRTRAVQGPAQHPLDREGAVGDRWRAILDSLGTGSLELFERLSGPAREYFRRGVESRLRGQPGSTATIEALYASDYDRVPPSPEVFLDHPDYARHIAVDLWAPWRPHFLRVCDPASGIFECDLTGAMGLGKTSWAMLVLAYKLCRMGHLRDPARFYGLQAGSKIVFGLYALTKDLVKEVGFYDLRDKIIDPSPFFRDVMPRLPFGKEKVTWPQKRIEVITGSTALHAIGKDLFAVVADELNYYDQGEKTARKPRELVSECSRRLESRFVDFGGDIPGIAIFISQTRTTSDFLELRIREAERKRQRGVLVVRGPRWSYCPKGYERIASRARANEAYLGDHYANTPVGRVPAFRVYVGDEVSDARVLDRVERRTDGSYLVEPIDPDMGVPDGRIIPVPVIHYRAFDDDLYGALRAIADEPTGSFTPFFSRKEVIEVAFDPALVFPFRSQDVACYERQSQRLQDAFEHQMVTRVYMGRRVPLRHPEAPRYIHLDLSQGRGDGRDRTGFVMLHPSAHYQQRTALDEQDDPAQVGEVVLTKDLEVDFYVAIKGGPFGEAIDYAKIRTFISFLRSLGYWIQWCTADQYMSADHNMRLRDAGFQSELLSTDRNSKPYRTLRQTFNEGRIVLPFPPGFSPQRWGSREDALKRVVLFNELTGLEHNVRSDKVDHRDTNPDGTRGSKDVADGLAGAVFRCLTDDVLPHQNPNKPSHLARTRDKLNRYLQVAPF